MSDFLNSNEGVSYAWHRYAKLISSDAEMVCKLEWMLQWIFLAQFINISLKQSDKLKLTFLPENEGEW